MATGRVRFDPQLEAIFGLTSGGFDGRLETYQSMLHPDDRGYLDVVHAAVAARSDYDVEHRCIWPDGSVHWLQRRGSVTLDANGDVSGTVSCVGDMTDRVLARGQAADLSASLQAALLPQLASPRGMGLFSKAVVDEPICVELPSEWTLFMFTDGLLEGYANGGAPERLGFDRIERWCADLGTRPLDEHRLDALLAFVEDANGGPVSDDIGVLALAATTTAT